MMRKLLLLLLTGVFCLFPAAGAQGAQVFPGSMNIDGAVFQEPFLSSGGKVYVPLKDVADRCRIGLKWEANGSTMVLTYPDQTAVKADIKADRIYQQDAFFPADFLLSGGKTYINVEDLDRITWQEVHWDSGSKVLYVYMYAYPAQGQSVMSALPFEGLSVEDDSVCFLVYGLPQASWRLEGELGDVRLIDRTLQGNMEEIQLAAFYTQPSGNVSQLLITQRKLPGGDRMFFTRAYSPRGQQVLNIAGEAGGRVCGGKAYHYLDKGLLNEYQYEEPFQAAQRLIVNAGTSLDQWHIFGQEDLSLTSPILKKAWDASFEYHKSTAWVTPEGTYRSTPVEYLNQNQYRNQNVNLQASTPLLLLDALYVHPSRLLEDFVHSGKFTLLKLRGSDGYWRSGLNVAYLNKSYGLGPNYIDTRMSVDASLFLVKYGLMFNDQDAVNKGAHFKQFFSMVKAKGAVYRLQGGVLYPDYYSESQKGKTLVSLNHALYEMNYLYTLYNKLGDQGAKSLADEMRLFINNSRDKWVAPNGDLYYALSPQGTYYAEDYVNITYVDLFTAKGILEYMEVKDTALEGLLADKEAYLDAIAAPQFESHLEVDEVLEKFDSQSSRKGDFFFPYPLEVKMSEGADHAYVACGTYHWIKGAESVVYLGKTYDLDPMKKYLVVLNKAGLTVLGGQ